MSTLNTIDISNFGKFRKSKLNKSEKAQIHGGVKSYSTSGAHVGQHDDPPKDGGLTGHFANVNPTDHWMHWDGGDNSLYAN
jgi:hypothetical protein